MLYLEDWPEYESYQPIDVLVNMFLIYNVILHVPVYIVNCFIMLKEFTLEFLQFVDPEGMDNDMALNFWDMSNLLDDTLWWLNPKTWWDELVKLFLNWGITALIQWIEKDAFTKTE